MRSLSFSARVARWAGYLLVACIWIAFVTLWVIEAGKPYP